jgi:hypothetical protein
MKKKAKTRVKHISETIYGAAMKAPAPASNYPLGRITLDDGTKLGIVECSTEWSRSGFTMVTIKAMAPGELSLPV